MNWYLVCDENFIVAKNKDLCSKHSNRAQGGRRLVFLLEEHPVRLSQPQNFSYFSFSFAKLMRNYNLMQAIKASNKNICLITLVLFISLFHFSIYRMNNSFTLEKMFILLVNYSVFSAESIRSIMRESSKCFANIHSWAYHYFKNLHL